MELYEQEKDMDGTLLFKYINETASEEERSQVDAWLAEESSNKDILLQVARIYHAQRTRKRIRQRNAHRALSQVNQRIQQQSRRIFLRYAATAASLFIGVLGIASLILQHKQPTVTPQMITVSTNAGMRSQLELPDGTTVHLNAGSTLVYPSLYDKNERRVQLIGEAYFKVTHNPTQPFIVDTYEEKLNVQVLGTEFNLQAYESDGTIQATLIDGSIQLYIKGKSGSIYMNPSDNAIYDIQEDRVYVEKINTAKVVAWMEGRLIFKDTPMPEVLKQLAHFYSVEFDIKDEIIRGYTFTGTFENRPLFQILDYMKISSKIDYTMSYPEQQEIRIPIIQLKKLAQSRKN